MALVQEQSPATLPQAWDAVSRLWSSMSKYGCISSTVSALIVSFGKFVRAPRKFVPDISCALPVYVNHKSKFMQLLQLLFYRLRQVPIKTTFSQVYEWFDANSWHDVFATFAHYRCKFYCSFQASTFSHLDKNFYRIIPQ